MKVLEGDLLKVRTNRQRLGATDLSVGPEWGSQGSS